VAVDDDAVELVAVECGNGRLVCLQVAGSYDVLLVLHVFVQLLEECLVQLGQVHDHVETQRHLHRVFGRDGLVVSLDFLGFGGLRLIFNDVGQLLSQLSVSEHFVLFELGLVVHVLVQYLYAAATNEVQFIGDGVDFVHVRIAFKLDVHFNQGDGVHRKFLEELEVDGESLEQFLLQLLEQVFTENVAEHFDARVVELHFVLEQGLVNQFDEVVREVVVLVEVLDDLHFVVEFHVLQVHLTDLAAHVPDHLGEEADAHEHPRDQQGLLLGIPAFEQRVAQGSRNQVLEDAQVETAGEVPEFVLLGVREEGVEVVVETPLGDGDAHDDEVVCHCEQNEEHLHQLEQPDVVAEEGHHPAAQVEVEQLDGQRAQTDGVCDFGQLEDPDAAHQLQELEVAHAPLVEQTEHRILGDAGDNVDHELAGQLVLGDLPAVDDLLVVGVLLTQVEGDDDVYLEHAVDDDHLTQVHVVLEGQHLRDEQNEEYQTHDDDCDPADLETRGGEDEEEAFARLVVEAAHLADRELVVGAADLHPAHGYVELVLAHLVELVDARHLAVLLHSACALEVLFDPGVVVFLEMFRHQHVDVALQQVLLLVHKQFADAFVRILDQFVAVHDYGPNRVVTQFVFKQTHLGVDVLFNVEVHVVFNHVVLHRWNRRI